MRIASLGSLPERQKTCDKVVQAILPQVDELHIYRQKNELGDTNKFRGLVGRQGYLFTIDDDVGYPPDYIDFMVKKIDQYDRKAIITCHGKRLARQPVRSFYGNFNEPNQIICYNCLENLTEDKRIHIPGTVAMAWHSDAIEFKLEDFKAPNMTDIWAGIIAQKAKIPIICAAHPQGWLKNLNDYQYTLFADNKKRNRFITDTINSIRWT